LTDGYGVYASYAKQVGLTRAECWSHGRREIFEAESAAPPKGALKGCDASRPSMPSRTKSGIDNSPAMKCRPVGSQSYRSNTLA
jgi:transposase IS66 family protein